MDGDMSRALDIALEHIFLEDMITNRHTLLTGRLVCRAWRASLGFSGKIRAVTLYTVADVQLAVKLLLCTPGRHPPLRDVEDSRIFPNLNTIRLSSLLRTELYESSSARDALHSLNMPNVEITIDEWADPDDIPGLHKLRKCITSVSIRMVPLFDSVISAFGQLVCLTKLTICPGKYYKHSDIVALSDLSNVTALRHLHLAKFPSVNGEQLANYFSLSAALSQLTRLDISDMNVLGGDIKGLSCLIESAAPRALHDFIIQVRLSGYDNCDLLMSLTGGHLRTVLCRCSVDVDTPDDLGLKLCDYLSIGPQYGASEQDVTIHMKYGSRYMIDLTPLAATKVLKLTIVNHCSLDPEETVPGIDELDTSNTDPNYGGAPAELGEQVVFTSQHGLPMAAHWLEVNLPCFNALDLTSMLQDLPSLFPVLNYLKLSVAGNDSQGLDHLRQLTTLSNLCLHLARIHRALAPSCPSFFPTSLRELDIFADNLQLPSLSDLRHLTRLTLRSYADSTWDTIYNSQAPITDLSLESHPVIHIDLPALVAAFPCLVTLDMHIDFFDVSPLSSLEHLRRLTLYLPTHETAVIRGAETLTVLASLIVKNANNNLEGFSNLAALVQLRHLKYYVSYNTSGSFRRKMGFMDKGYILVKQLRTRMPHTSVVMCVDNREVESDNEYLLYEYLDDGW